MRIEVEPLFGDDKPLCSCNRLRWLLAIVLSGSELGAVS